VFSSRVRAALLVSAFALALLALPLSQAGATVTASQITSPTDQSFLLAEDNGAKITIAGTTTGAGAVDINCYYGSSYSEIKENVTVVGEAFSVEVPREELYKGPCLLRAVPHEDKSNHEPGEPADPFKGPRIAASEFEGPFGYGEYFAVSDTFAGAFYFETVGSCGLEYSKVFNATTFEGDGLFGCDAAIYQNYPEKSRSDLQIDGVNAYSPASANEVEKELGKSITGAPHVVASVEHFEPSTGLMTIHEVDPVVECSPETVSPPTGTSCEKFVSAGVELERTWQTSENDHVAKVTDTWRSTDGSAHALNALYAQEFGDNKAGGGGTFDFPGSTAFVGTTKGQSVALPAGAGAILYKSDAAEPEAGDGEHPQGAVVYDSVPSGPIAVFTGSDETSGNGFDMPYARTIPAGGTYTLRMAYVQAYGLPEVNKLAQETLASYYPSVSITSPANGATATSSSITVTGAAKDEVGLASLTVNGEAVSVGAGGAWSTTVALNPGANTITATATNQAGNSKSSSVAVTYTPPPAKPAPATASQVGNVSGSKGQATLSLACHGTAGTSCKVHVTLTTVEKLRHGHLIGIAAAKTHSKTVTVATLTITIPAGQTVKVTLKLNATGRKLLKRFGKLPSHITAILEGEAGHHTVVAQNLTIKPVPKKHKH
jgi:hypothetical protein